MAAKKVLFFSGSIGLGHVARDLAIARALRDLSPDVEISWLAAPPADRLILDAGELLLPEAKDLADASAVAEQAARGARLSLIRYAGRAREPWTQNAEAATRALTRQHFDLLVGDETYEMSLAYRRNPALKTCPFVMIYDFVGFDPLTRDPMEWLGVHLLNRMWVGNPRRAVPLIDLSLFIGDESDVPDRPFGFMLPNRREWARRHYHFVGPVFPFDPASYADRAAVRRRLGYGPEHLIICSIGGTAVGKQLLELCAKTYPLLLEAIPNLRMVLVAGPRLSLDSLDVPAGVHVHGYVPALHEHFAASDLAIVQGGGTTTLELVALRRPFIYFPIEGHSEQEIQIAGRMERLGAGVRLSLSRTTPESLARTAKEEIGKEVTYASIPTDGARRAAELINTLLEKGEAPRPATAF